MVATTYVSHYMCTCVCVCAACDMLSPFGETGNNLQFAEKADLSLAVVLKLQYTAGAAYSKARSISCAHACLCVFGATVWVCVCVYVSESLLEFCVIMLMAQLTSVFFFFLFVLRIF